jgi:small GTP-binding protein
MDLGLGELEVGGVAISADIAVFAIIAAVIFLILGIIWRSSKTKAKKGNHLLLLGECGGGKTALLFRLASPQDSIPATVSSMTANEVPYVMETEKGAKTMTLVDIPGSGRVRAAKLRQHAENAACIVFVVDSVKFPSEVRHVGEILRSILMDKMVNKLSVPILVFCNKQDLRSAVGVGTLPLSAPSFYVYFSLKMTFDKCWRKKSTPFVRANERSLGNLKRTWCSWCFRARSSHLRMLRMPSHLPRDP